LRYIRSNIAKGATTMTILVIDIGTSQARALLYDEAAQLLPQGMVRRRYPIATAPLGKAVVDAEAVRSAADECMAQILQHPAATALQAVIVVTFEGSLIGVTREGKPVTPIYTVPDPSSTVDARLTGQQMDLAALHQRTGCVHHPSYAPIKLHWLKRTQPDDYQAAALWVDIGTYLYLHWLQTARVSYAQASTYGLLQRETLQWDSDWLHTLKLSPAALPRLADYSAAQKGLAPRYAHEWSLLADVPFFLPVSEGAAAAIGSGAGDESLVALTMGMQGALRQITPDRLPPVPSGLSGYRVDQHTHLISGVTSEGGNIFQWAQQTLALSEQYSEETLLAREPDSHGLTVLPLLNGERSPGWSAAALGSIHGITLSTTPLDMLHALLESVALRLALIADQMTVNADVRVMASGGALDASPAWGQILANALNRPLYRLAESDIIPRGAAVMALKALGKGALTDYLPYIASTIEPNPESAQIYRAARARQVALYEHLV
jgi:gluconokinase